MLGGKRLAVAGIVIYAGVDTSDPEGRQKLTHSLHAKMTKSHRFHVASAPAVCLRISRRKKTAGGGGATLAEYADPLGEGIQHALIVVVLLGCK